MSFIREYIVRSASEERWRLPNPRYTVQIIYSEFMVFCYVWDEQTHRERETFSISKRKNPKDWKYLANEFGELAINKYPREMKSREGQRREDTINRMRRILR